MNGSIGSIIFLAFIILVPVGMVVGLVILAVRKARGRSAVRSIAKRLGWEAATAGGTGKPGAAGGPGATDGGSNTALRSLLEPTLFAMRRGRHELSPIASGRVHGVHCWIAEYHYRAPGPARQSRRGGVYSLLVMERRAAAPGGASDPDTAAGPGAASSQAAAQVAPSTIPAGGLMIQHRQRGALAAAAEKFAAGSLEPVAATGFEWALVSSNEALAALPRTAGLEEKLHRLTIPGDTVFLFPEMTIWSRSTGITNAWADGVPAMLEVLAGA